MIGSIQPNAYVQGYLCFMILYLTKNEMLDPLNGALATGAGMNLPMSTTALTSSPPTRRSTSTRRSGSSAADPRTS